MSGVKKKRIISVKIKAYRQSVSVDSRSEVPQPGQTKKPQAWGGGGAKK